VNHLIDTNIIFEIRKARRCDPNVARWYEKNEDASLYLSVLVIGEIRSGIEKVRTKDTAKANALEQWLITVDKAFGERILPVDRAVAHEWGRLKVHRSLPVVDGLAIDEQKQAVIDCILSSCFGVRHNEPRCASASARHRHHDAVVARVSRMKSSIML
jgi:toxin FitB